MKNPPRQRGGFRAIRGNESSPPRTTIQATDDALRHLGEVS